MKKKSDLKQESVQKFKIFWSYLNQDTESYVCTFDFDPAFHYESEKTNKKKEKFSLSFLFDQESSFLICELSNTELCNYEIQICMIKKSPNEVRNYVFRNKKKLRIEVDKIDVDSAFTITFDATLKPIHLKIPEIGIINKGSTCYMSSLFQVLNSIKAFKQLLFSISNKSSVIYSIQKLFYDLMMDKTPVSTDLVTKSFGWSAEQLNVHQDIQEFNVLLSEVIGHNNNIFEGEIQNYISCTNVNYKSNRIEKFTDICLNIKGESIYRSFEMYTEEEVLDGQNKYDAGEYGKQIAKKGISISKFPAVLLLQLKRMEYSITKKSMVKINTPFEFGEKIDLYKFATNKSLNESFEYQLFSVVVHSGSATKGHYYCYILKEGTWILYDDEYTRLATQYEAMELNYGHPKKFYKIKGREVQEIKSANESSAYILIYIKVSEIQRVLGKFTAEDIPHPIKERIIKQKQGESISSPISDPQNISIMIFTKEMLIGSTGLGLIKSEMDIFSNKPLFLDMDSRVIISIPVNMTIRELVDYYNRILKLNLKSIVVEINIFAILSLDSLDSQPSLVNGVELLHINSANHLDSTVPEISSLLKIKFLKFFIHSPLEIFHKYSNPREEQIVDEFPLNDTNSIIHSKNLNSWFFEKSLIIQNIKNPIYYFRDTFIENEPSDELNARFVPQAQLLIIKKLIKESDNEIKVVIQKILPVFPEDEILRLINLDPSSILVESPNSSQLTEAYDLTDKLQNFYGKGYLIIIDKNKFDTSNEEILKALIERKIYLDIFMGKIQKYLTTYNTRLCIKSPHLEMSYNDFRLKVFNHLKEYGLFAKFIDIYHMVATPDLKVITSQDFISKYIDVTKIEILVQPESIRIKAPFFSEFLSTYVNKLNKHIEISFKIIDETKHSTLEIEMGSSTFAPQVNLLLFLENDLKTFKKLREYLRSNIIPQLNEIYRKKAYSDESMKRLHFILYNSKANYIYNCIDDSNNNMVITRAYLLANNDLSIKFDIIEGPANLEKCFISIESNESSFILTPFVVYFDLNTSVNKTLASLSQIIKDRCVHYSDFEIVESEYYSGSVCSQSLKRENLLNTRGNDPLSNTFYKNKVKVINIIAVLSVKRCTQLKSN